MSDLNLGLQYRQPVWVGFSERGQGWRQSRRLGEEGPEGNPPPSLAEPAEHFLPPLPRSAPLQRVSEVSSHWWYSMLILPPLLKDSMAAPLLSAYYPDCVGMSPSCASTSRAACSASPGKLEPSKAAPAAPGENWARPSMLPALPAPGSVRGSVGSRVWLSGAVVAFVYRAQVTFPSIIWEACSTYPVNAQGCALTSMYLEVGWPRGLMM